MFIVICIIFIVYFWIIRNTIWWAHEKRNIAQRRADHWNIQFKFEIRIQHTKQQWHLHMVGRKKNSVNVLHSDWNVDFVFIFLLFSHHRREFILKNGWKCEYLISVLFFLSVCQQKRTSYWNVFNHILWSTVILI